MATNTNLNSFKHQDDNLDTFSINSKDTDSSDYDSPHTKPPPCFKCNVYNCKCCNGNRPKLDEKQKEIIQQKNLTRTKPIPYKICNFGCSYCTKVIPKSNQFVYERKLEIQERRKIQMQQKKQAQEEIRENIKEEKSSKKSPQTINLINLSNSDRILFSKYIVKGDGNCAIRAILESAGLNQELHPLFREALANEAENMQLDLESLKDNGFSTKRDLVKFIRTQNNFIGMDHALLILEKYNVNINIWLDNQISGLKWIKLNENGNQTQPKIYVNYKDYKDVYPDKPEYCEKIAHYDALVSDSIDTTAAKNVIEEIILKSKNRRQEILRNAAKSECKILLWNINSLRDFTKRSYLVQQLYENQIDIALLNETMLTNDNSVFIKGYKIFRSDGKGRKGVAILVNKILKCDSFKISADEEGRHIQIKLKQYDNEITIATAYVEPDSCHISDILPHYLTQADIFAGDLNKMQSGLKITNNVYHIKNIGELSEKIEVIKKISDHPILIFKKQLPFLKSNESKTIKVFDKTILENNLSELQKSLIEEKYIPNFQSPIIEKSIKISAMTFDDKNYNSDFEEIKAQNKERFNQLKKKQQQN